MFNAFICKHILRPTPSAVVASGTTGSAAAGTLPVLVGHKMSNHRGHSSPFQPSLGGRVAAPPAVAPGRAVLLLRTPVWVIATILFLLDITVYKKINPVRGSGTQHEITLTNMCRLWFGTSPSCSFGPGLGSPGCLSTKNAISSHAIPTFLLHRA